MVHGHATGYHRLSPCWIYPLDTLSSVSSGALELVGCASAHHRLRLAPSSRRPRLHVAARVKRCVSASPPLQPRPRLPTLKHAPDFSPPDQVPERLLLVLTCCFRRARQSAHNGSRAHGARHGEPRATRRALATPACATPACGQPAWRTAFCAKHPCAPLPRCWQKREDGVIVIHETPTERRVALSRMQEALAKTQYDGLADEVSCGRARLAQMTIAAARLQQELKGAHAEQKQRVQHMQHARDVLDDFEKQRKEAEDDLAVEAAEAQERESREALAAAARRTAEAKAARAARIRGRPRPVVSARKVCARK